MTAMTPAVTSQKTPFDAVREAEETAAKRLMEEEQKLQKEYDAALKRAAVMREEAETKITEKAREELQLAKVAAGKIIDTYKREAEEEGVVLQRHAESRKQSVMTMLKQKFLLLR